MTEFVQSIAVQRGAGHEDTVRAAARASIKAHLACPGDPAWATWLAGPWVKSVRRARIGEFDRLAPTAAARDDFGTAHALSWVPTPRDALPDGVSKLQVSGTDFERLGWPTAGGVERGELQGRGAVLVVNEALQMTTGKTAAQASHALFAYYLELTEAQRSIWAEQDLPFGLTGVGPVAFADLARRAVVQIADAGRTEIEPGSVTVVVLADDRRLTGPPVVR